MKSRAAVLYGLNEPFVIEEVDVDPPGSGEVLVEIIYNWPGLGLYSYNAILSSDFPAIQGFVLLVTALYMAIYLLLDLATAALDPRVKF